MWPGLLLYTLAYCSMAWFTEVWPGLLKCAWFTEVWPGLLKCGLVY